MTVRQSFQLAIKNILASKVRAILTMLGIIIGVGAVIVIVGLGHGMETYMTDSFQSMGTNLLTVTLTGRGSNRNMSTDDLYELVEQNPEHFTNLSPTVSVHATLKIGDETINTTSITGVSEAYAKMKTYTLGAGRFLNYVDVLTRQKVCVVGSYINKEYFLGDGLGQTIKLNGNTYTVVGVLNEESDSEKQTTDDSIYIPYSNASKLMNMRDINSFSIEAASEENISAAKKVVEDALYDVYRSSDAYFVMSMSEILDMMTDMVNINISILTAIAAISLVVGGIGIMNIMLVSVSERTREIGIRKALGAKQKHIMRQFVIEAATTSALGGVLGIGLGYLLCNVATRMVTVLLETDMTVAPSASAVGVAFGISALIGILFGYLPAKKAARLNPIEALRYE